jgi:hypothetical protein
MRLLRRLRLLWFGIKLLLPLGLGIVGSIIAERVVEDNLFLHSWMEITTITWVLGLLCSLGLIGLNY